jgi:hypothetical protein
MDTVRREKTAFLAGHHAAGPGRVCRPPPQPVVTFSTMADQAR